MRKSTTLFAAAAFAVAGLAAPWASADDKPGQNPNPAQQPAAARGHPEQTNRFDKTPRTPEPVNPANAAKLAPDAGQIRSSLARIVDAAIGDDVQSLYQQLDKADQARLDINPGEKEQNQRDHASKPAESRRQSADQPSSDLRRAASQLKKDWKEKYGQDLQFANQQAAFTDQFARIIESNPAEAPAANAARTAAGRIPPGERNKANTPPQHSGTVEMRGTDHAGNQTPGVKVATVTVPESHGAPQVTVHLTSDSSGQWRLDIPNTLDRQKLEANLAKHVRQFDEQKGVWPKDVAEASRMAAHHVLLALADKDTAAAHDARHGNNAPRPDATPR